MCGIRGEFSRKGPHLVPGLRIVRIDFEGEAHAPVTPRDFALQPVELPVQREFTEHFVVQFNRLLVFLPISLEFRTGNRGLQYLDQQPGIELFRRGVLRHRTRLHAAQLETANLSSCKAPPAVLSVPLLLAERPLDSTFSNHTAPVRKNHAERNCRHIPEISLFIVTRAEASLNEHQNFLFLALVLLIIALVHLGSLSPQHKSPRRPVRETAGTLSVRAYLLALNLCRPSLNLS